MAAYMKRVKLIKYVMVLDSEKLISLDGLYTHKIFLGIRKE